MSSVPVIVTRPERDAARWVQDLQAHGLQAEAMPLITITLLPDSPALRQTWKQLDTYTALMFVSGNAADGFFASNQAAALVHIAQAATDLIANGVPRFLAPGPGTVAALRHAGIPQALIDAPAADAEQFDSEALWALLADRPWQGQRVLVLRGQSVSTGVAGRDWLARQLEAAGAQVDFACVYERRAPLFTAQQLQRMEAATRDGSVWLFSSSEAVGNLPPHDWSRAQAIATHPRIAEAVRKAGWGVVVQSRPTLADIVASIESTAP